MAESVIIPRPSAANRWAHPEGCPGSVALESVFPDDESDSALEGNAAHELLEKLMCGNINNAFDMVDRPTKNGLNFTEDMAIAVTQTYDYAIAVAPREEWNVEQYVHIDSVLPGFGGTLDLWHYDIHSKVLTIPDLKYGWGIVEVFENYQLLSYAIGLVHQLYDGNKLTVNRIDLIIHQPRPHHPDGKFRMWSLNIQELNPYFDQLKFTANDLNSLIRTGSHCRYCLAMRGCPAGRKAAMQAVVISQSPMLEEYSNDVLSIEKDILDIAMITLKERVESISGLIEERINDGQIVKNYGFERSRTNVKWKPDIKTKKLKALGTLYGVTLINDKSITPTQAKKAGLPQQLINELSHAPETGLKLKRRDATQLAKGIFGDAKPNS